MPIIGRHKSGLFHMSYSLTRSIVAHAEPICLSLSTFLRRRLRLPFRHSPTPCPIFPSSSSDTFDRNQMPSSIAAVKKWETNGDRQQLFDTGVFDGLRVFFNFLVVFGPVMYFLPMIRDVPMLAFILSGETEPLLLFRSGFLFFLLYHTVDVFLFLSGYLFGLPFCGKKQSDSTSSQSTYTLYDDVIHMKNRFLRLFPVWFLAWLWSAYLGFEPCRTPSSILYEMFYVCNLNHGYGKDPAPGHTCMIITWSLSTDVQAHLVMAIIVSVFKSPRRSAFVLVLLTVLIVGARAQYMMVKIGRPMDAGFDVSNLAKSRD